ncbi:sensor histidine kinase [Actinomadura spongiicola]|uniref:histidine kinase n=1 Tax=Actinomadura spongiicola TaxID=2303421 RepID=A0A372GK20_9ACTN|nr:HAMP domain-containing sensor histidine kinase [Actinomadura spongiicola]RFS85711.1 sensor histidine kinase [Actinomadura spongiicola]
MSVRNAAARLRPRRPRPARAHAMPAALGAAGSLLVVAVAVAAVALSLLADARPAETLATVMALLGVTGVGLMAWAVRRALRWALRPVKQLQADLAEIGDAELSHRVPVPSTGDDVERLADRVNTLLGRLEGAAMHRRAFIADASHELRTPITALRARIELALDARDDGDPMETLRSSMKDVDRLHLIVEDLLILARLDSGDLADRERLDLGALVETVAGSRAPPVPTTVKAESGVLVEANPPRLGRVLLNLLANAERHAAGVIEVAVRAEPGEAVVEVRDDGPGIPPADRERIFERFARVDTARSRADGGSGLGLAIARQIAVAHGGRLYVGDGAYGARLVLRLPLC